MKLFVPCQYGGALITEFEVKRARGGVLADTKKAVDDGDPYAAMSVFVTGMVEKFIDSEGGEIDDLPTIKSIVRNLAYVSAEGIAFEALIKSGVDDSIDTMFKCPKCKKNVIYDEEDGPRVGNLPRKYSTDDKGQPVEKKVVVDFGFPISVKNRDTGEELFCVNSMSFRLSTMEDVTKAFHRQGLSDTTRLQYAAWAEAILEVNGKPVERSWRLQWGEYLFNLADSEDLKKIGLAMTEYGVKNYIDVRCSKCGKEWKERVSIEDFFASGLLEE